MAATAILSSNSSHHDNRHHLLENTSSSSIQHAEALSMQQHTFHPIMSRLPLQSRDPEEKPLDMASPYLTPHSAHHLPGTLPHNSANDGITYTLSRLPTIDPESLALWTSLHSLHFLPQSPSLPPSTRLHQPSATQSQCPFSASRSPSHQQNLLTLLRTHFNFSSLVLPPRPTSLSPRRFYGVIFRSIIIPRPTPQPSSPSLTHNSSAKHNNLYMADKIAHEEAVASGGLLAYIYGRPDAVTGANIATCVWSSRADARRASGLEEHRRAVGLASGTYDWFELGRYAVVWEGTGVRVEEWEDGDIQIA